MKGWRYKQDGKQWKWSEAPEWIIGHYGPSLDSFGEKNHFSLKTWEQWKQYMGMHVSSQIHGQNIENIRDIFYESRGNLRIIWWVLCNVDNVWNTLSRNNGVEQFCDFYLSRQNVSLEKGGPLDLIGLIGFTKWV